MKQQHGKYPAPKNTIKSLAVLIVLITAAMFTSCNKGELETVPADRVVTITIAPPSAEETKVTTSDNGSKVSITGWKAGDAVNLYKVYNDGGWKSSGVTFTCSNPATNAFTGTLPADIANVSELNLALYNCSIDTKTAISDGVVVFHYSTKVSKELKDVIALAGVKSGGKFTMKVANNIVKVRNTTLNDIEAAWKTRKAFDMLHPGHSYVTDMTCKIDISSGDVSYCQLPTCDITSENFDKCKFTLKSKTDCYLPICPGNSSALHTLGLSAKGDGAGSVSLIGVKLIKNIAPTGGRLYTAPDILPKGALRGVFTVSYLPQKRVHFAKGNLYYTGSAWALESNQYDYRTCSGKDACILGTMTTDGTPSGNVGLFYWTSSTAKSFAATYTETGTGSGDSFFANTDNSVIGSIWNVLTKDEWSYLLNSRTDAALKVGFATVHGVQGVILLPDSFTDPMKNKGNGAFVPKSTTGHKANIYSEDDWKSMESAGAVFLPATGYRSDKLYSVGEQAYYWSATAYSHEDAYSLFTSGNSISIDANIVPRDCGFTIRLVTAAE